MTGTDQHTDSRRCAACRGQTNLPVLAVALILLVAVTGMTLGIAEGAYLSAERDATERSTAVSIGDRLVAADENHTKRQNVLDAVAIETLTAEDVQALVPSSADMDVRIRIGDRTVVDRGSPESGTTIRRIVLVAEQLSWTGGIHTHGDELTVPNRTDEVALTVHGEVETIRLNGRVVVHDPSGIETSDTPIRVATSRDTFMTVTADGRDGVVEVEAVPERSVRTVVAVTVNG